MRGGRFGAGPSGRAVAVVGVGCRLPGGIGDLDGLWGALEAGRDLVTEVPAERFDQARFVDTSMPRPGKSYTAAGGFLDDIASFDADYFGIAPREAAQMDPQQRLLLEMTAEALDDAGLAPESLAGSDTAVFVGISDHSYGALQMLSPRAVNAYTMSGAASSIAANRLSHHFDLRGPSIAVDTACSSSLVALVQAQEALLSGRSRVALAGGVNVLLSPYHYVGFSQASMLSPSGRCRSFSAGADGYVRAEGGGVVLLKRLTDALADGDRIHAVVVDSAVGSDGRTPGLALPNADSQEALLRQVYHRAGIDPDDVAYLEAHGTGTPAGDPIECHAIGKALGVRRTRGALPIGSVKSNLGHSEPASGITGLLKGLLVLRHRLVPPTLHATPPNPHVDFAALRLAPAVDAVPIEVGERTVVGVNSFGFGGANAHAILAAPPVTAGVALPAPAVPADSVSDPADASGDGVRLPVVVSARTRTALVGAMCRTAERLASARPEEFYDLAYTTCVRRGRHPHRAVVLAADPRQAAERLLRLAEDVPVASGEETASAGPTAARQKLASLRAALAGNAPGTGATVPELAAALARGLGEDTDTSRPHGPATAPEADAQEPPSRTERALGAVAEAVPGGRCVFVFSGNGAQWPGMARDLYADDPVFREAVEDADRVLEPMLGWSVAEEMRSAADADRMASTEVAQPLLFAVQLGIVRMLGAQGVEPAAVVGHSVGEIAAACVAGALTLEEAALLVATRSRVQSQLAQRGRMASVTLSRAEAEREIEAFPGVDVACVNTSRDVTVAGPTEDVEAFVRQLHDRRVACTLLDLDHAFHTRAMDPGEEPLKAALAALTPCPTRIPMVSSVTGAPIDGATLDAAYWWHNMRQPVLFAPAIEHLLDEGYDVFAEIGPHPILRPYIRRITGAANKKATVVPTVRRGGDAPIDLHNATAALLACAADPDWGVHFPRPGRVATLPAYPWQRQRHWSGDPSAWTGGLGKGGYDHPLLGDRLAAPAPSWVGLVDAVQVPWLAGHRVGGAVILPATGFAEMALAAGRRVFDAPAEVEHLELYRAVVVPWDDPGQVSLHVTVSPEDGIVTIGAGEGHTGEVRVHARGRVRRLLRERPAPVDLAAVGARCARRVDIAAQYRELSSAGLDYGPSFQVLCEAWTGDGEVLATYRHTDPANGYEAHPALLDGALQAGAPLLADLLADGRRAYLPGALDAVRVWRTPPAEGMVHVRERARSATEVCWDVTVMDRDGTVVAELEGCRLRGFDGMRSNRLNVHDFVMRAAPDTNLPCEPSPLPGPSQILKDAEADIERLLPAWREQDWDRARQLSHEMITHSTAAAFADLLSDPVRPFTVDDLIESGVLPRHRDLLRLFASLQEEHGLLRTDLAGRWELTRTDFDVEALMCRMVRDLPAYCTEIALYTHNADHIGELLRGTMDPLEALVSDGGMDRLEDFFSTAPGTHHLNRTAQALVRAIVSRWPKERPLRVLEIGAGTGGTTRALLPLLPPERTRYTFTDVSALFCVRAEKRLAAFDFVEYRTFDLNGDPAEQGFTDGGFDLVVAANALHTARDLTRALSTVRRLLAPGGQLLAVETHNPLLMVPLFGFMEAFWDVTDHDLRPETLLLPAHRWPRLLRDTGYTDIVQTAHGAEHTGGDFSVLLAATPHHTTHTAPLPTPAPHDRWIVAGDPTARTEPTESATLTRALTDALRSTGPDAQRIPDPEDTEQWHHHLAAGDDTATVNAVFVLDGDVHTDAASELDTTTRRAAVLRAFATACERLPAARRRIVLWLITRPTGALPAPERPLAPADAAIWGLTRTLANEHPGITVRRLSLERGDDPARDGLAAARELLTPGDEDEIVLTRAGRFVPRLTERTTAAQGTCGPADVPAYTLKAHDPGLAYRLAWTESRRPRPGPGEIVIAVHAAALNYRDLMQTIGVLPADANTGGEDPGMECAGIVEAVGEGVTGLRPGDRVAALAPGAFASHVRTFADAAIRLPDGITFAQAATMPVVFLTVQYSLGRLARLTAGETVLVHGGAGGVGLAVLQYARHVGARVIATAGDPVKRSLLRSLGVEHVLDSRSMDFAEHIRRITAGRGVDVVVNSLAGEGISRSLETLAYGGRFIELGKRDIYENKPLLLRPFAKNIAFFGVDLTALLHEPELAKEQFRELGEAIRSGRYRPLLHTVRPAARIADAFRLMQHSRHIGKLVITFDPADEPPVIERHRPAPAFHPDGTYLVTGGLSGFGAATARWLADHGARRLALVGRRGDQAPEADALLADLASRGVHAGALAADVTDPRAVEQLLRDIESDGHPLRGIVHCAMHLDDAPLTELTDDRFRAVLAPKLVGARVLDTLTRDRSVDLFLAYSSATGTVGHLTQAPYVAGNLYLEALTRQRRHTGLPANAVAWGAIGETGYVARNNLTRTMTQAGIEPLTLTEAFRALDNTLVSGEPCVGIGRYNWIPLLKLLPAIHTPRIAALLPTHIDTTTHTRDELLSLLAGLSSQEAHQFIADSMAQLLVGVLQTTPEHIDHHRRLDEYGLDSLMATEMLVTVRQQYDIDIPPMELLRSNGTIADFARIIHTRLGLATPTATPTALPGPRTAPSSDDTCGDAEADAVRPT